MREKPSGYIVWCTNLNSSHGILYGAGLAAIGKTTISRIYHLDRGFYNLESKLNNCGASIKRISE